MNGTSDRPRRGACILLLLAAALPAQAQEVLATRQLTAPSPDDFATPEESGLRAGPFDLRAAAGLGLGFDSNVLAAPRSGDGESMGSAHLLVQAQNRASRHQLAAAGFVETRRHGNSSEQDASEYGLGAWLLTMAGLRDQLEFELTAENRFERRGEIETPTDVSVSHYDDLHARLRHTHLFNRLSLGAGAESRRIAFGAASQTYRDRWQHRGELHAAYALRSGLSWTGTAWFNRDEYDATSAFTESADSVGGLLGLRLELRDVLELEFGAGWFERRFDSAAPALDGVALRGALRWQPTRLTRLRAQLSREDEPTAVPGSFGKVRNALEFSLAHDYSRRLSLVASARAAIDDFAAADRQDQIYAGELGAGWLLGRHSLLRLTAGVASRASDAPIDGFSRHYLSLTFTGRL